MKPINPFLILAFFLLACASSTVAQVLSSINFTPKEATNWGNSAVRLDFGNGLGLGTATFTSVNGGFFQNSLSPATYNAAPFSSYNGPTLLSNGYTFAPTEESVFTIQPGAATSGLAGFTMTMTLDSGDFTPGSVFSVRSLGSLASQGRFQYAQPGTGLTAPLPDQLPTDGASNYDWKLLDAGLSLYGNSAPSVSNGASRGLAMGITGNSFTVSLLATPGWQPGGVAFTVATAPVPEVSSIATLGIAFVGIMITRKRKQQR